ncbi:MAG: acetate--CoA ligase family protein [Candidatus Micrarchaeota archaeon]
MARLATEREINALLKKYGIPHVREETAKDFEGLLRASKKLRRPWVLKIISPEATHKTDRGLVRLHIDDEGELVRAFEEVKRKARGLKVECFLLQEQKKGVEFIVGGKRDASFGKVLVFGLGGVFVELLKERAIRVLPAGKAELHGMVRQTKAYAFVKGYRNQWVSEAKIVGLLEKTARMLEDNDAIEELDFNPVIANGDELWVADARIVLRE